jgi:ferredoxin
VKLRVDPDRCEGYGTCAQILPEIFVLDEYGYAHVPDDRQVPAAIEQLAQRAILECPMNAIVRER